MKVLKRSGQLVPVKFDQITTRIVNLTKGLSKGVDATKIAQHVSSSIYDGISTQEIDSLSAEIAVGMMTENPDYEILAARIVASNIQKKSAKTFYTCSKRLHEAGILDDQVFEVIVSHKNQLVTDPSRDFDFGYFGLKTLEKSYLMEGETPQFMFMRVAVGIHMSDIPRVLETYEYLSLGKFIHATPTLFNAGTKSPQMSSCFLVATKDDSIDGIYDTLKQCANISKWAGGIGLHVHNVRANGALIKGTNGVSDGIVPMLRVFNATARYVNQAGRRKGSIAVYLEPWHADIMEFLELRLNQGDEEARTRDLFTAMWIPDFFMKRVKEGAQWSLMCPSTAPGLADVYGADFEKLYLQYESEGRAKKVVRAQDVWTAILKSQTETGTPYMLYKDACNKKSNQKNLGVIKSSNLCVAPETKILTRRGYQTISSIPGTQEIWNGEEWSTVTVRQTSESSKLIKVSFSDGSILECTEYHTFHLADSNTKQARDLTPGDQLLGWTPPVIEGPVHLPDTALEFSIVNRRIWLESQCGYVQNGVRHVVSDDIEYLQSIKLMLHTM
jgi:ribonucleotide reductase alpha subunit